MEAEISTYTITILGKKYEIKCPEQEKQYLITAVDSLKETLCDTKEKYPSLTEFQLMMMSALSISRELIICKRREIEDKAHLAEILRLLEQTKPLLLSAQIEK